MISPDTKFYVAFSESGGNVDIHAVPLLHPQDAKSLLGQIRKHLWTTTADYGFTQNEADGWRQATTTFSLRGDHPEIADPIRRDNMLRKVCAPLGEVIMVSAQDSKAA